MRKIDLQLAYELALEQENETVWNPDKLNVIAHYLGRETEWEQFDGDSFEPIANDMIKQVYAQYWDSKGVKR